MPRRVSISPVRDPLLYDTFLLPNGLAPRRVRVHVPTRGPTVRGQRPALFLFFRAIGTAG